MSHIEYEVRVLEINIDEIKSKLESFGAILQEDVTQKRYVYDFNPVDPNKWIRLRTNGTKTTLTIDGTKEMEIVVDDFDTTNEILNELGYKARNAQENKRIKYDLNGVEVDIDSWPMIPTYLEVEGSSEEEVYKTLELLGIDKDKATSLDVTGIYKDIYNIDIMKISELTFNVDNNQ